LVHPDDLDLARRAFGDVLAGRRGPTEPLEFRVRGADGQYRVLETVGDDLRHDPAIGGIVLTSHDVTERNRVEARLREATAELSALVSALHDGVLLVGRDGNVVFVNDAFRELAGLPGPSERHVGQPAWNITEAMSPRVADPAGFEAATRALIEAGRPATGETVRMADGRVFERDYLPVLLARAPAPGRLWLYRDVTARVAGEEYKMRLLESERRARESTEEQNRSLLELNAMKNDFVATVSHELRTPLTSIVSFASLLAEEPPGLTGEQQEFLSIIRRNADRLIGLVGDLLLIARVEFGTLEIEPRPFDIAGLVRTTAGTLGPQAAERSIGLRLDLDPDPAPVVADEGRIEQVLANLLANALKFTPEGGTVTVGTRRTPGAWSVSVRDTGIGIPKQELDQLFERFFRGSNARTDQHPGSGLGLAICHAIVGLHGGTLDVQSEEGRGTCVTVRLPDRHGDGHPGGEA
ncbi:MAG TPA: ATP-binding protein, partial [Streptosporangiaceae bacterium]